MCKQAAHTFSVLGLSVGQIVDKLENVILTGEKSKPVLVSDLTKEVWEAVANEIVRRYFTDDPDDDLEGLIPAKMWMLVRPKDASTIMFRESACPRVVRASRRYLDMRYGAKTPVGVAVSDTEILEKLKTRILAKRTDQ